MNETEDKTIKAIATDPPFHPAKGLRGHKWWVDLVRAAVLPVILLLVVLAEHYGVIDRWRGLDLVEAVADNFSLSYAPNASAPIYPEDAAWKPLIALIERYSSAKLRRDKQPQTVARMVASLSTQEPMGSGRIAEWTSPSTPVVVFYRHWPNNTGQNIPPEDFTIVGTIGELQNWIVQSRNDFYFLLHDMVLGLITLGVGYSLWHMNHLQK
jgi:hypothetical protein